MINLDKDEVNFVYEATKKDSKDRSVRFGGLIGAGAGGIAGVCAASFIGATTGGSAFLMLGVAAVGVALGAEFAAKATNRSFKEEEDKFALMSESEVSDYKMKTINEIRDGLDSLRNKEQGESLSQSPRIRFNK